MKCLLISSLLVLTLINCGQVQNNIGNHDTTANDSLARQQALSVDQIIDASQLKIIKISSLGSDLTQQLIVTDINGKSIYFIKNNWLMKLDPLVENHIDSVQLHKKYDAYDKNNPWEITCQNGSGRIVGGEYAIYTGDRGIGVLISSHAIFRSGQCDESLWQQWNLNLKITKETKVEYSEPIGPRSGFFYDNNRAIFLHQLNQRLQVIQKDKAGYIIVNYDSVMVSPRSMIDPITGIVYSWRHAEKNATQFLLSDSAHTIQVNLNYDGVDVSNAYIYDGKMFINMQSANQKNILNQKRRNYIVEIDLLTSKTKTTAIDYNQYLVDVIPYSGGLFLYFSNTFGGDNITEVAFYDFKH